MWLDDDDDGKGWDGVYRHRHRHHIIAIYMKHDTINNQPAKPNNQPKKHDATTTTIYSRYTFTMIPPSFEKDNVFFLDGWMEQGERERKKRELYNVEKRILKTYLPKYFKNSMYP